MRLNRAPGRGGARALLAGAFLIGAWTAATAALHINFGQGIYLARLLFLAQDYPVLILGVAALAAIAWLPAKERPLAIQPNWRGVGAAIACFALLSWAGHYLVFSDYAMTRDEQMSELASRYLAQGRLGMPIPDRWQPFARAILPIFYSPFGADHVFASVYLPVSSAVRAGLGMLGDPNLAGPVMTAVGLAALFSVARRLFPDRPDSAWVTMAMGLSSTQLLAMAMTPYAMPQHFGLDMLWLALVLRREIWAQVVAGLVLLAATGLHQWHFTPLFVLPFLLWFALGRRWLPLAVQSIALIAGVLFWVDIWPAILAHVNGAPPLSAPRPRVALSERLARLFDRLEGVQPLFSLSRFIAWNNILLAPLAGLAVPTLWSRRHAVLRGQVIILPLLLVVLLGMGLMLYQKHGWGYRYLHAAIGPACLLAGFGWQRLSPHGTRALTPILASLVLAAGTASFLLMEARQFVLPYANAWRMIRDSGADVALVDWRGTLYGQDLVRIDTPTLSRPVGMDMYYVREADLDRLCANPSLRIRVFDRSDILPWGVPPTYFEADPNDHVQRLRDHMRAIGCGRQPD